MSRGRPTEVSKKLFLDTVLPFSSRIYVDSKIVPKNDPVYTEISSLLQSNISKGTIQSTSIYTMLTINRHGVFDKIKESLNVIEEKNHEDINEESSNESLNKSDLYDMEEIQFEDAITQKDSDLMTEYRDSHSESIQEMKDRNRKYLRFKKGVYQSFFNKIICKKNRITVRFQL